MRLLELAAKMEEPRTIATTRVETVTCDKCGDQIRGLNRIGDRCESTWIADGIFGRRVDQCIGTYRLDSEPETDLPMIVLRCDECGVTDALRPSFEGRHCYRITNPEFGTQCMGTLRRLDSEPATDRDGNDLGVSMAELAAEQAIRDFLADDPDNDDEDTADWPDIASTYRGRRK